MCNRCGINDTKAIKIRFREIMSMRSVCLCVCVCCVRVEKRVTCGTTECIRPRQRQQIKPLGQSNRAEVVAVDCVHYDEAQTDRHTYNIYTIYISTSTMS